MDSVISKFETQQNRQSNIPFGMIFGVFGIFALLGARLIHWLNPPLPACMFKSITGYPCPTCGMTRSIEAFAEFHFWQSFLMNPLFFLAGIGIGMYSFYSTGIYCFKFPKFKIIWTKKRTNITRLLAVILIVLNWGYLIIMHR
jgi:hypothetical protein